MFTRQRRNYRNFVYAALIVALCALVIALFWPKDQGTVEETPGNTTVEVNNNTGASEDGNGVTGSGGSGVAGSGGNAVTDGEGNPLDGSEKEKPVVEDSFETYYLVKKDGDRVKVFFSNGSGDLIELEETQILYELLPAEDQSNFDSGIKVSSQEELSLLLQDFES